MSAGGDGRKSSKGRKSPPSGKKHGSPTRKSLQDHNDKHGRELKDIAHIGEKDLEAVGKLYSSIIRLYKDLSDDQLDSLTAQFDNHIQYVMESLNERLQGINDHFLRCGEFVLAKHAFHDVCIAEILKHVKYQLKNPALEDILSRVFRCHQELMAQFPRVVSNMHASYREEIMTLRAQLNSSERETYSVLEAAEILEKQKLDETQENRKLEEELRAIKAEKEALQRRIKEEERKRSQLQSKADTLARRAQQDARRENGGGGPRPARPQKRGGHSDLTTSAIDFDQSTHGHNKPPAPARHSSPSQPKAKPAHSESNPGPRRHRHKKGEKWVPPTERESFFRLTAPRKTAAEKAAEEAAKRQERKEPPPEYERELTLNQLRAVIEEIYVSKQKFDLKCDEAHLPYETMEQHVYTFLNHKYGLKTIILGWLKAIKQAVKEYKDMDPDVQCFGKILSNDLHEGYLIDYHYNLKKKINQLLYTIIQIENPKASDGELAGLFDDRVSGQLQEEEWRFMVRDMYPQLHDQEALVAAVKGKILRKREDEALVRARAREENPDEYEDGRRSIRRKDEEDQDHPALLYKDFVQVVLDYQLNGHVQFLKKFKHWFNLAWKKSTDPKKVPGIIDEFDFTQLVKNLHPGQGDDLIVDMLDTVDPFETRKITFSQCASILMPILIHIAEEEDFMAQKNEALMDEGDEYDYHEGAYDGEMGGGLGEGLQDNGDEVW